MEGIILDSHSFFLLSHCKISVIYLIPIFNKTLLKFPNAWVWDIFPKEWKKSLSLYHSGAQLSKRKTIKHLSRYLCRWLLKLSNCLHQRCFVRNLKKQKSTHSIVFRAKTLFLGKGPQPFFWWKLAQFLLIWENWPHFNARKKRINL